LKKVHVYRETAPYVDAPYGEDGTKLRWKATLDVYFPGTGTLTWRDTKAGDDGLGDLLEYTISQNQDCINNIDKSKQGVAGLWGKKLVFSDNNEIMWSDEAIHTPYGSRFLMYPAINMWPFAEIGRITDLIEQQDNLVALSEDGISVLVGDNIANMYDKKVDDTATIYTPVPIEGRTWWDWTTAAFDSYVLFVDSAGRPRIFNGQTAQLLTDKTIIPRKKEVAGVITNYDLDAVRYRNGYLITNGEKIFVWAKEGDRWVVWNPKGTCERFLRPNAPWLSTEFTVDAIPEVSSEGEGLPEIDTGRGTLEDLRPSELPQTVESLNRTYLYTVDGDANLWSYGTRENRHLVNMRWVTDKSPVEMESLFYLFKFKWRYLPYLGYEKYELAEVPQEPPTVELWFYGDNQDIKEQNEYVQHVSVALQDRKKPGTYDEQIAIAVRVKSVGFQMVVPSGRFFQLIGYEFRYNLRGQRTYGA